MFVTTSEGADVVKARLLTATPKNVAVQRQRRPAVFIANVDWCGCAGELGLEENFVSGTCGVKGRIPWCE